METDIAHVLFKSYRRKALALLMLHPESAFHVREIARLTGTAPGTMHRELKLLADAGILKVHSQGNQRLYAANQAGLIYQELASILRKTAGLADILVDALLPLSEQIEVAFVYGSMASGKARPNSDVDVAVVGDLSYRQLVAALHPCEKTLGRDINPKLFKPEEWAQAISEPSVFMREIMEQPAINLLGKRDDFTKSCGKNP
ncbi:MAG: nucleotidyltransferase domain-containing protein [Pseudomonadota bacterium]